MVNKDSSLEVLAMNSKILLAHVFKFEQSTWCWVSSKLGSQKNNALSVDSRINC